jgi:adenosylcobinamide-phosphate synthase
MIFYLQLLAAIFLDALIGDPRWYPHPVRWIGRVCSISESVTRSMCNNLYVAGLLTVVLVIALTVAVVAVILYTAAAISPIVEGIVGVILLYTTIAARDLLRHSTEVFVLLRDKKPLDNARMAVGKIVGRDTARLTEEGICRATIETVAENMVDGITAPLFFALLASCCAPIGTLSPISWAVFGAFLYKAINTMDSMIAYKNERYIKFGRVAAKLDDAVNFIPARLSGSCLIMAAFFLKLDYRKAAEVFLRDRLNHSSPNAGHTEAAAAGALGVQLGGPSLYFNEIVEKPFIGDAYSLPVPSDIQRTNILVIVGSLIFFAFFVGLRMLFM